MSPLRNGFEWEIDARSAPDTTPPSVEMEEDAPWRLYSLCPCEICGGTGKDGVSIVRCKACRGEGRILTLKATATDKESVGVALCVLAEEGEWDECPFGLMYRPEGQPGKWLLKPWGPSARNVSDAARTLAKSKTTRSS